MVEKMDTSAVTSLEKREIFAVRLRKDKKEKLLANKRHKLFWKLNQTDSYELCLKMCPELSQLAPTAKVNSLSGTKLI
jgi:hypothetical protein